MATKRLRRAWRWRQSSRSRWPGAAATSDSASGGGDAGEAAEPEGAGTAWAPARARSTSWPGPATPRTARPTRRSTGSRPFEKATGCKANVQVANTSDEMFEKMGTGDFDVVSASGDSSLRMIYAGKVAPVNTALLTNWADIAPFQKSQQWNSVGRRRLRHPARLGRPPAVLAHRQGRPRRPTRGASCSTRTRRTRARSAPTTRRPTWRTRPLYLMATKPDLGIKNPYALDKKQFDAAVDAGHRSRSRSSAGYWAAYADAQKAFTNGTYVLGTSWQIIVNLAQADKAHGRRRRCPRRARPAGPTPGWSTPSRRTRTARTCG